MNTRNFLFLLTVLLGVSISSLTFAAGDASSAKLKVYGAWLSTNGDCSDPIQILDEPNGTTIDMLQSPTLAEKAIPLATYKCLVLNMNDVINFIPKTDDGSCVAGQVNTIDVCRPAGQQGGTSGTSKDVTTGKTITCTDSLTTGDKVFIYISVDSFCEDSNTVGCGDDFNAFAPPTKVGDKVNGIKLQNEIVVDGNTVGNFIFDLDGKIQDDGNGHCDMMPPLMGYK